MLFQQAIEIGHLRDHADRAEDGKRRRQDFIRHAGHHVATAGGDLIDTHRQIDTLFPDPLQLRRREPVSMHHAASALQAHDYLVAVPRHRQHRGNFPPQARHRRGSEVTVEIEHENARFRIRLYCIDLTALCGPLERFAPGFAFEFFLLLLLLEMQLEGLRIGNPGVEREPHGVDFFVDPGGLDMAFHRFLDAPGSGDRYDDHRQYGNDKGGQLGGKQAIFKKELSHAFLLLGEQV